jgi:hypothetical protein
MRMRTRGMFFSASSDRRSTLAQSLLGQRHDNQTRKRQNKAASENRNPVDTLRGK